MVGGHVSRPVHIAYCFVGKVTENECNNEEKSHFGTTFRLMYHIFGTTFNAFFTRRPTLSVFYLPVTYSPPFGIEVYPYLHYWQA